MTPAEQAALALWIEIEPYSHEPWASNDPGFAVKRIAAAIEQARREEREECIEAVRAAGRQVHETPRGPMTSIDVSALFYIDAIRARAQEGTHDDRCRAAARHHRQRWTDMGQQPEFRV